MNVLDVNKNVVRVPYQDGSEKIGKIISAYKENFV